MINKAGLFSIDELEVEKVVAECERRGWRVFRLPTNLSSKDEFFEGVRRVLPLDPILQSNRSWDALADSLWAGLDGLDEEKIVIIWPDSSIMELRSPKDYEIAVDVLRALPDSLADKNVTAGPTKQLLIIRSI
ncbi:barstar family protein [Rhizobacter sp. SG703]|uniref:barstar family protein n=1 Tax=Rhizobacter sp. SG703 TaxID=2587140 RepID=UPI001445519B|nr:barstar family protein [Rhizobacter sp. SG703]NKI96516.1 hypothetical protein [Rhizobacter sp. SG703]